MPHRLILLCLCLLTVLPRSGIAAAGDWQGNAQLQARLIGAVEGTGDLAVLPLGLEVSLAEGWKTYWRMPGDAGAPPQFDWPATDNPNLAQMEMLFPAPQRHVMAGLETIGYHGHVVFPLNIIPKTIGAAMPLAARLTILTCAELCIPNDLTLRLTIPEGDASPGAEAPLIEEARARVPQNGRLSIAAAVQDKNGGVTLSFMAPEPLTKPEAFIETAEGNLFTPPQITLEADGRSGTMRLAPRDGQPRRRPLTLTVTLSDDGQKGWDDTVELKAPEGAPLALHPETRESGAEAIRQPDIPPPLPQPPAPPGLGWMIMLAVLGGLILNLMPCVLPVLSLKVLKFVGHGGRDNAAARQSFLLASAGIMTSFLIMAAALLALRAAGHSIGWGIQFQHPGFLIFLIAVLMIFAANLWGWFTISLPDALTQRFAQASSCGRGLGDFLSGAFAALLATPCTAPFLGTAVGFALGSDDAIVLAIFAGLGLGMALPYLLVAAFPVLATKMPRPGRWMLRLKQCLGLALAATALWLGYVLIHQLRPAERDEGWRPFVEAAIADEVAAGHVVFVDVTAGWCITCQTNKKLVLDRPPVRDRLFGGGVIAMQADWTRPDPAIAAYLKGFHRAGIPFNAVYGPGAPQGLVLPELLTAGAVMEALDKASGKE